jgi:3-phosphoshikimate 1-carboxyvinyltransferase
MIIKAPNKILDVPVTLPASKSISNRLLIIQALSQSGEITNLSDAEDTVVLQKLLCEMPSTFDVGHAGTAYRFLTTFLSISKGSIF